MPELNLEALRVAAEACSNARKDGTPYKQYAPLRAAYLGYVNDETTILQLIARLEASERDAERHWVDMRRLVACCYCPNVAAPCDYFIAPGQRAHFSRLVGEIAAALIRKGEHADAAIDAQIAARKE